MTRKTTAKKPVTAKAPAAKAQATAKPSTLPNSALEAEPRPASRPTVAELAKRLDVMTTRVETLEQELASSKNERRNEQVLYTGMMFSMMGELFTGQANFLRENMPGRTYLSLERAEGHENDDTLLAVKFDAGYQLIQKKDGAAFNEHVSSKVLPAFLETLTEEEQALPSIAVNLIQNTVAPSEA